MAMKQASLSMMQKCVRLMKPYKPVLLPTVSFWEPKPEIPKPSGK